MSFSILTRKWTTDANNTEILNGVENKKTFCRVVFNIIRRQNLKPITNKQTFDFHEQGKSWKNA